MDGLLATAATALLCDALLKADDLLADLLLVLDLLEVDLLGRTFPAALIIDSLLDADVLAGGPLGSWLLALGSWLEVL